MSNETNGHVKELTVKVDEQRRALVITIPMESEIAPSASGKTLVVASSHGNVPTAVQVQGRTLRVGVNAYIAK